MADNVYLGKDIELKDGDIQFNHNQDFSIISYEANLVQAIITRLSTNLGEYYNKYYGSELYKVYGSPNSDLIITEATGYIVASLNQEARIDTIDDITISYDEIEKRLDIDLTITPINSNSPINLIYNYYFTA